MPISTSTIIITGAAGLVGQNLITMLEEQGYYNLVAIDKHEHNLGILKQLHPKVTTIHADLATPGPWQDAFNKSSIVVQLHAQITGNCTEDFVRNNQIATDQVLTASKKGEVDYLVHISSSVVNSTADDDYTRTKAAQELAVRNSGIPHAVLRPTLMFGWFDPKHFGWLSRFMDRVPVFPIPGDGRYMRQPLYNRDFCKVIKFCLENQPQNEAYDIVGGENIDYVDIIKAIKAAKKCQTPVICIPYSLFSALLFVYALFSKSPPFTQHQLKALTAGDEFTGVDMHKTFGITPTPFTEAISETFTDKRYKDIVLTR